MDVQRAITLANAIGGRVFEIDGPTNKWVALVDREDGSLVCICDMGVREFSSQADFLANKPMKTIALKPRVTGLMFS